MGIHEGFEPVEVGLAMMGQGHGDDNLREVDNPVQRDFGTEAANEPSRLQPVQTRPSGGGRDIGKLGQPHLA